MGHSTKVVNFVRSHLGNNMEQIGRITEIPVMKIELQSRLNLNIMDVNSMSFIIIEIEVLDNY